MQNIHCVFGYVYNHNFLLSTKIVSLFVFLYKMNTQKVFLLLNGEKPTKLPNFNTYDIICTTDGAYEFLKEQHIIPDFISGDFDSLKEFPKNIEIIHTPNQDFTDFDKILAILFKKGFKNIDVYGASGKEGNLHTALQWHKKLKLTFFDDYSRYFLADKKVKITAYKNQIISLIPLPRASKITTKGLQYPLNKEDLSFGERIGTRNKAIESEVEISFESGNLFIFINH